MPDPEKTSSPVPSLLREEGKEGGEAGTLTPSKAGDAPRQKESPLIYVPSAGTHISSACEEAVALAIEKNRDVSFTFNDIELSATKWSKPETIAKCFDALSERRRKEYRESPEGIKSVKDRKEAVAGKQRSVDALLLELPLILKSGTLDQAIKWLRLFQPPSDDIDVKFSKSEVAQTFIAFGYAENEHVGNPPDWFNTRERMGRYVIGQAINCLKHGLPPHGRTLHFCKEYFKLGTKQKKTTSVHEL